MTGHLAIALSTKGYGETILGLQLSEWLRRSGDEVHFLVHPGSERIVRSAGFPLTTISDHVGSFMPLYIEEIIRSTRIDRLLLADYFTTDLWLAQNGLDVEALTDFGLPMTAIDTWHMDKSGDQIDIYWGKTRSICDWRERNAQLIQPVPIAGADAPGAYCCLPPGITAATAAQIADVRSRYGLCPDDRLVLFCTARWQQTRYSCRHAQRISETLPDLIAHYIRQQGPTTKVMHIGPQSYELDLQGQYFWVDQIPQSEFVRILGAADLLLTANVSSTTIARAMAMDVPVLALVNSHALDVEDDTATLPFLPLTSTIADWISANLPIYPFLMWPVGYYDFLKPLIPGNAYFDAIAIEEIFDEPATSSALSALLFDRPVRSDRVDRQRRYIASLELLPFPPLLERRAA